MDRSTQGRFATQPLVRGVLVASMLLSPVLLLSSAGGCKAIRERRAQRAAERESRSQVENENRSLPNADRRVGETQGEWLARQRIAQQQAQHATQ